VDKIEIRVVETEEELLEKYEYIKEVPLVNVLPRELLIKCLQVKAAMLIGEIDGEYAGTAVIEKTGDNIAVLAVSAKNNARKLMNSFYSWAKGLGVNRVTMMSKFDRDSYERLLGVKLLTAIYEKDLTEWEQQ